MCNGFMPCWCLPHQCRWQTHGLQLPWEPGSPLQMMYWWSRCTDASSSHPRYPWVCLEAELISEEPAIITMGREALQQLDLFASSSAQLQEWQEMHLIHILLAIYKAGQAHAVQQLEQSVVFCPIVLLVVGFLHFWDRDNSESGKQGLQEVKHHFNVFLEGQYRDIFQILGKWKFMLRTDSWTETEFLHPLSCLLLLLCLVFFFSLTATILSPTLLCTSENANLAFSSLTGHPRMSSYRVGEGRQEKRRKCKSHLGTSSSPGRETCWRTSKCRQKKQGQLWTPLLRFTTECVSTSLRPGTVANKIIQPIIK